MSGPGAAGGATDPLARARLRQLPLWLVGAAALEGLLEPRIARALGSHGWETTGMWVFYLALGGWAWHQCARVGVPLRVLLGPVPTRRADWALTGVVAALVPLSIGALYLVWLPISFTHPELVARWMLAPDPDVRPGAPVASAMAVLLSVVAGPVIEEVVYRGVLLHRLAARRGAARGAVASALLFGVVHADVVGAVVFGLVLTALYVRTGSLWIPIACHVLNNASAALAELLDDGASDSVAQFQREWWVGAIALAVGVALLWGMRARLLPPRGWGLPSLAAAAPRSSR